MALVDEIAKTTRDLTWVVAVNNTIIRKSDPTAASGTPGLTSLNMSKSFDARVPVAAVGMNRIPNWIDRGALVQIWLGYNGLYKKVFTGTVQDRSDGVREGIINCAGNLHKLFRDIEIAERDLNGLNTKVALESILDDVDIPAGQRSTADVPTTFTLGSASDAKLQRMRGNQMADLVMDLESVRVYEDGEGIAQFKLFNYTPASTSFRSFSTDTLATARIIGGGVREDPTFTRTRVTVRGATVVTGSPPDEVQTTLEEERHISTADKLALVKPPLPTAAHIDAEVSNSLADTAAQLGQMATQKLVEWAKVPKSLTVEVPGDPELELGQTLTLTWPELNASGQWFIYGIGQRIGEGGYFTILDLRGGSEFGISIEADPVASFSFTIARQVFADRVQAEVTFDASASYDPDGDLADLTYAWSDNQTTTPDIADSTEVLNTVRIDPAAITGTWTVTLTVTDADGNTAAVSRDVDVAETASLVEIPAIYAAIDTQESCTPDGGENWIDNADVGVISVGARPDDGVTFGQAVFGTSDGKLLRTTDSCENVAEVHSVASERFEAIEWDWRDVLRVWALTRKGKLFISLNSGASFSEIADMRDIFTLGAAADFYSIGLPAAGGVWVYGGDGQGNPFIGFSTSGGGAGGWRQVTFGGELQTDLDAGPAASTSFAIVDATDKGDGSGIVIVCKNADAGDSGVRPVYHKAASEQRASGAWSRGTGFAAGDVDAAFVVGAPGRGAAGTINFIMAFHDRSCWRSPDGIVWTEEADVLPANHIFNHAVWAFAQTHNFFLASFYVAAVEDTVGQTGGIYKSTDEAQTWGLLRPATGFDTWPASAIGRQVAMGRSQASEGRFGVCRNEGASGSLGWRNATVAWSFQELVGSGMGGNLKRVRCLTNQLWFLLAFNSDSSRDTGAVGRTKDGGATWDDPFPAPTDEGDTRIWQDFAMTTDGTLWGLTINATTGGPNWSHAEIWKSTDDGDNWTEVYDGAAAGRVRFLVAHPTDPKRILAYGTHDPAVHRKPVVIFSIDGGDTFNVNSFGSNLFYTSKYVRSHDIKQLTSNRLIIQNIADGSNEAWWTSDDNGATWDERTNVSAPTLGTTRMHSIIGEPSGVGLYTVFQPNADPTVQQIYASYDGAVTWADLGNDVPTINGGSVRGGIAYDPVEKALYTFGTANGRTDLGDHIWKLFPISASGTWKEVAGQILPFDGDASYNLGDDTSHGIAVIPRA